MVYRTAYNRCATLIFRVGRMPWTKIGATHYLLCTVRTSSQRSCIKEFVVGFMLLKLIPRVFVQKRRYLAHLSYPKLLDLTLECQGQLLRPYRILKYLVLTEKKFLEKNNCYISLCYKSMFILSCLIHDTKKIKYTI